MRAIVQDTYGSADVLELRDIDRPKIGDGEVLVRVHAASVHVGDVIVMSGSPYVMRMATGLRRPKVQVPGTDIAGTVEAVGTSVTDLRPGDEVFGWCTGAFAEYASASQDHFVLKPANLTFEQAAAVGVSATTALQILRDDGKIQPGQKVLINGASGGVGTFAVQIAKAFGAEVTGVTSSKNVDLVRSIGADHVVDYIKEDFRKGGPRYDFILDNVGDRSMSETRRALAPTGTLLSNGGGHTGGKLSRVIRATVASMFVRQQGKPTVKTQNRADLVALKELVEAGKITPVIDATYPLRETPRAIGHVAAGHARGTAVIAVPSGPASVVGGSPMDVVTRTSTHSPVLPILAGLAAGALLAGALLLSLASGGSEPLVTGSILFAFGLGWGLMAWLSTRYSAQPQAWMAVPATFLGSIGLALIVFQPGPAAVDLLSWAWPPALAILAIWMIAQVRRQLRGRGRWLVVPVIATLLLVAVGGGLATVGSATGSAAAASTGRMVDVGGHRLNIECSGSGGPAVVLQSGLGESSSSWSRIAPAVAASTTVCVYDRAGHGRSDEASGPQDGIALATDLHTLLQRAGVPGPYVLVGHSSGGPYVRLFAARYPDEVAGMVLLDPQPADAFTALPTYPLTYQILHITFGLGPSLARIGFVGPLLGLPADQSTVAATRAARDEVNILPTTLDQAQALSSIGARPLIVVTALSGAQTGWASAHDAMMDLSTNARHIVIASATHNSIISGEDSPASTQAIFDVVTSIRSGTALR